MLYWTMIYKESMVVMNCRESMTCECFKNLQYSHVHMHLQSKSTIFVPAKGLFLWHNMITWNKLAYHIEDMFIALSLKLQVSFHVNALDFSVCYFINAICWMNSITRAFNQYSSNEFRHVCIRSICYFIHTINVYFGVNPNHFNA